MRARLTWPAWLAGSILLLDLGLLVAVGVSAVELVIAAFLLAAATGAGALCLRGRERHFPDRATFLAVAAAFGLALHMVLTFVLFHTRVESTLGISSRRGAALVVAGLLGALGVAGAIRLRGRLAALPACAFPRAASVVLTLASLVAIAAHFGFGNDVSRAYHTYGEIESGEKNGVVIDYLAQNSAQRDGPVTDPGLEWGGRIDSLWYVWLIPRMIESYGLPGIFWMPKEDGGIRLGQFQHVGVALQVTAFADTTGPLTAESSAAVSKPLALAWLAILAWISFVIARTLFDVTTKGAVLVAAGSLVYAALNPTILAADFPLKASHLFTSIAAPIHWNLNQLAQLAIGLAGLYLVLADLARPRGLYARGALLLAVSMYFKPSLYFVVVPALGLASLRLGRGFFRADVLLGWVAIVGAAVFWHVYPRAIGLNAITSPISFGFFELQQESARGMQLLPASWLERLDPAELKALLIALAYAALLLPALVIVRDLVAGGERRRSLLAAATQPHVLALLLAFAWGAFSGACFSEDNDRRSHFNYFFGGAAAYVCFLPLLVRSIERIETRPLRALAWLVYCAHLASGIANLSIYVRTGSLV